MNVAPFSPAGTDAAGRPRTRRAEQASLQLNEYLTGLVEGRRAHPGDDLLSGLVAGPTPDGRMTEADLLSTMRLLLVAGHETTVNLITNGMLTMLRHPDVLDHLRADPELVVPPVGGTAIPQGATVVLLLASGSRDLHRFPRPDECVPDRADNTHLGFGGGLHYCVGAPLARIEAQIALTALSRHLVAPRLLTDPPPTGTPPPYAARAPASRLRGPAGLTMSRAGLLVIGWRLASGGCVTRGLTSLGRARCSRAIGGRRGDLGTGSGIPRWGPGGPP